MQRKYRVELWKGESVAADVCVTLTDVGQVAYSLRELVEAVMMMYEVPFVRLAVVTVVSGMAVGTVMRLRDVSYNLSGLA